MSCRTGWMYSVVERNSALQYVILSILCGHYIYFFWFGVGMGMSSNMQQLTLERVVEFFECWNTWCVEHMMYNF